MKKKKPKYSSEDWNVYPWPEPGAGVEYGPTDMQEKLFIYHLEPWERPHHHNVDIVLMIGGKGSGKCYPINTPILMSDGAIKPVQDIVVGDTLLGFKGEIKTVKNLVRGREMMYKIIPTKGEPFICNESHILTLKKSGVDNEVRTNPSGSLYIKPPRYGGLDYVSVSVKEYLTWSKRKKNAFKLYRSEAVDFYNDLKTDPRLPPYILGLWLGDGHSRSMSITSMDGEIVDEFQLWADKEGTNTRFKDCDSKAIELHISGMSQLLRDHNLFMNKHIPLAYKTAPIPERLELLAGLIDTDGNLDTGIFEIIQKNKILAEDIVFVCRSLGFAAYMKKVRKGCMYKGEMKEGDYYRIFISGDTDKIPTRLPRKQASPRLQKKSVLVTGLTVEKLEEDNYYGFSLAEEDKRYLLGDFTVVHNSLCGVAEIIELALSYPKCAAIVAGVDMPMLKRNVMDEFGFRLSWTDPDGISHPWQHPTVLKPPPEKTPIAPLFNGSTIRFLGIDKDKKMRGFTADLFMIDEVNLLTADSLKEMFSRSRGKALPVRQFILTMNPSGRNDWIDDMFNLKQLRKDFVGEMKPHGEICKCQFCNACLDRGLGEFEWEGGEKKIGPNGVFYEWIGGECPNPECPIRLNNIKKKLPPKGHIKTNTCPGAQNYYRVIQSASFDNPHNPSDFVQLQKGALSEEEFRAFVAGEIIDLNTGVIYKDFNHENIQPVEFNPNEDIYWTMDFNFDPMCSQICQDSSKGINVVDEFTIWNADEMDVAKAFVKRYKGYTGKVWLYGDPNGILVRSRADSSRESFVVIRDFLKLNGFDVEIGVKKIKNETLIPIITRVNNLKAMIRNVEGERRVFINPKCVNLIESLRNTKWKEKSTSPKEDDQCDANAKGNPKRAEMAVTMTHPQAALGYLVSKRFPIISGKKGVRLLIDQDKTVVAQPEDKELRIIKKEEPEEKLPEEKPIASMLPHLGRGSIIEAKKHLSEEAKAFQELQDEIARQFFG